jgi:uncharacterized protein (DUF1919 family)
MVIVLKPKPIRLLIWGCGEFFRRNVPFLRDRERKGEIRIVGVVDRIQPTDGTIAGYPIYPPEAVPMLDYDYLQILSTKNRTEIREQYLSFPGSDPKKVLGYVYPELSIQQYLHIVDSRPTIFINFCWGGYIYYYLGMECLSPFKNLWLNDADYLRFLHNPRMYMALDPILDGMQNAATKWDKERFPVLRLGDIRLYCNHSDTAEQAIEDWVRRREKINWDSIIAVIATDDRKVEKEFHQLDTVSRKLCFVPYETEKEFSMTVPLCSGAESRNEMVPQMNAMASPYHNPYDIYSVFFGELRKNPCFDPNNI